MGELTLKFQLINLPGIVVTTTANCLRLNCAIGAKAKRGTPDIAARARRNRWPETMSDRPTGPSIPARRSSSITIAKRAAGPIRERVRPARRRRGPPRAGTSFSRM